MRRRLLIPSILILSAMATVSFARTERNSFLNRHANSVTELINQIRKDPEVRARYERHFGKSANEIIADFSKLRLGKLAKAGKYWVYNVDDEGVVNAKLLDLKAGTPVFFDAQGRPVLKKSCGNAMKPGTDEQAVNLNPDVTPSMDLRDMSILDEPTPLPLIAQNMEPAIPEVLEPPIIVNPPVQHEADIPIQTGGSGWSIPGILLAGGGVFVSTGGGSPHTPPPVPEPATLLVLGVGFGIPTLLRRFRRHRS
jgi:hypothetical protein